MDLPFRLERPLAVFDIESTGTNTEHDRIVELAILVIRPDGSERHHVMRFNPETPIPAEVTAVHGISDEDVRDEPTFGHRMEAVRRFFDGADLAGYNIRQFDLPLLLEEFRRAGSEFDIEGRNLLDAKSIFFLENPRDLTAAVAHYLGEDFQEAHHALSDAKATARVLLRQAANRGAGSVEELHATCDEFEPYRGPVEQWFDGDEAEAYVFRRGKYKGFKLSEVARHHWGYLHWMAFKAPDMPGPVRKMALAAMRRWPSAKKRGGRRR